MQTQFGKLLRLDVRRPAAGWSIVALGLRNPVAVLVRSATGDLYIGDVGQGAIEEVSFTPRASPGLENYGWDLFEGSRRFEEKAAGPGQLVFPVFEYGRNRGSTVTGGYVYRGKARPSGARSLHRRRLLQRHRVELPDLGRRGAGPARRALQDLRRPELVRRERRRRALRDSRTTATSTASRRRLSSRVVGRAAAPARAPRTRARSATPAARGARARRA